MFHPDTTNIVSTTRLAGSARAPELPVVTNTYGGEHRSWAILRGRMGDDDVRIRGIIRLKLEMGTLPKSASGRLWAGPGGGETCSACDETITRTQTLHEWEHRHGKVVMHVRCWELWNGERARAHGPRPNGGGR